MDMVYTTRLFCLVRNFRRLFIYLFIYLLFHLFIHGKKSSGITNSNTMTSILKPKNPNPNIIITYNMLLKKLVSTNAVFKNFYREGV